MKKLIVLSLMFVFVFISFAQAQNLPEKYDTDLIATEKKDVSPGQVFADQNISCYPVQEKVTTSESISTKIDEAFGSTVKILAKVLFYEPSFLRFTVTDKQDQPVMQTKPVVDAQGKKLQQLFFLIQGKEKTMYDKSAVACLDAKGEIQIAQNGKPGSRLGN